MAEPDEDEIAAEQAKALEAAARGLDPWPAMTYVQGVADALGWVTGDEPEPPLAELDEDLDDRDG